MCVYKNIYSFSIDSRGFFEKFKNLNIGEKIYTRDSNRKCIYSVNGFRFSIVSFGKSNRLTGCLKKKILFGKIDI